MSNFKWIFKVFLTIWIAKLHLVSCRTSLSPEPSNQQQSDKVSNLPGQNFDVSFEHYAGYVTVNEESGRALFYWFFEAEEDPSSKPLVLWLNGGPGCSSIGYGLADEIGPFHVEKDGKTLYLNPYSWNKAANLLFLDTPVGAGFAYSNTSSDILTNSDNRTAAENVIFLRKWFERFPQYKEADFYMTGESYAGHYLPQLGQAIVKHNQQNADEIINLKGFMVGNALTDDIHDRLGLFQFMWTLGMISDQTYQQLSFICDVEPFMNPSEQCQKALDHANEEIGDIDMYNIFKNPCRANSSGLNHVSRRKSKADLLRRAFDPCTEQHSTVYFNLPEVQDALHVGIRDSSWKWVACSDVVFNNWQDYPHSVLDVYRELLPLGLRIWIFSGHTDVTIPVTSTRYTVASLKLPTISPWRPWYDDGEVGGWQQEYEGLTFVVVRGSGHKVPTYKPKLALTLINSYLSGHSMPELEVPVSDS